MVDTHYRPSYAKELMGEIKKVTPLPVKYVINTHWHNDHVQGNQGYFNVYGKGVEFLSHELAREDIVSKAIPSMKTAIESLPGQIADMEKRAATLTGDEAARLKRQIEQQKAYLAELKQIEITLPTLTFDRSAILHKGDRQIQLLYFGRGHTRGDIVTYLPREKVVVMGDLLTGGIPFARDGYPSEWAETLVLVAKLDVEKVIPGHGGVMSGKQVITDRVNFTRDVVAQVKKGLGEGKSGDAIKAAMDVSKYQGTFAPDPTGRPIKEWPSLSALVDRAIMEAKGELK